MAKCEVVVKGHSLGTTSATPCATPSVAGIQTCSVCGWSKMVSRSTFTSVRSASRPGRRQPEVHSGDLQTAGQRTIAGCLFLRRARRAWPPRGNRSPLRPRSLRDGEIPPSRQPARVRLPAPRQPSSPASMPPSTSISTGPPPVVDSLIICCQTGHFTGHGRNVALPAEARVDGHDQHLVNIRQNFAAPSPARWPGSSVTPVSRPARGSAARCGADAGRFPRARS